MASVAWCGIGRQELKGWCQDWVVQSRNTVTGWDWGWTAFSLSERPNTNLSQQIHPWDSLHCCWDVKQLTFTKKQTSKLWAVNYSRGLSFVVLPGCEHSDSHNSRTFSALSWTRVIPWPTSLGEKNSTRYEVVHLCGILHSSPHLVRPCSLYKSKAGRDTLTFLRGGPLTHLNCKVQQASAGTHGILANAHPVYSIPSVWWLSAFLCLSGELQNLSLISFTETTIWYKQHGNLSYSHKRSERVIVLEPY